MFFPLPRIAPPSPHTPSAGSDETASAATPEFPLRPAETLRLPSARRLPLFFEPQNTMVISSALLKPSAREPYTLITSTIASSPHDTTAICRIDIASIFCQILGNRFAESDIHHQQNRGAIGFINDFYCDPPICRSADGKVPDHKRQHQLQ